MKEKPEHRYQSTLIERALKNKRFHKDGKPPPDMSLRHALQCAEMSTICYRENRSWNPLSVSTKESWEREVEAISKYAAVFRMKAKVFSTHMQQAVVFYNDRDIIVTFEGSNPMQLRHYNRNLTSYFMSWWQNASDKLTEYCREQERESILLKQKRLEKLGKLDKAAQKKIDKRLAVVGKKEAKKHWGFDATLDGNIVSEDGVSLWEAIRNTIDELQAERSGRDLCFTGHSSGGVIAEMAADRWTDERPNTPVDGLYTYAQPRGGNRYFTTGIEHKLHGKYYRFDQYGDPMPALPPYRESGYVHAGNWIPMDMEGHVLVPLDKNGNERSPLDRLSNRDTFTYADQEESQRIKQNYLSMIKGSVYKALSATYTGVKSSHPVLEQILSRIDPVMHGTHASLGSLFGVDNFSIHAVRSYATAIHLMIVQQLHSPELEGARELNIFLRENSAQHLIYALQIMEDALHEQRVAVPEGARRPVSVFRHELKRCLDDWEKLNKHPPNDVFPDSGAFVKTPDEGSLGRWTGFITSLFAETNLDDSVEEVLDKRSFRSAYHARAYNRQEIVANLSQAIMQFEHDVQLYVAQDNGWYLNALAELANDCKNTLLSLRSLAPQFDATPVEHQAKAMGR